MNCRDRETYGRNDKHREKPMGFVRADQEDIKDQEQRETSHA